jgi:autotransporter family porin
MTTPSIGNQALGVVVPNPNPPFGNVTYNVYNNANFVNNGPLGAGGIGVGYYLSGNAAGIMNNLRLGTVTNGTMLVDLTSLSPRADNGLPQNFTSGTFAEWGGSLVPGPGGTVSVDLVPGPGSINIAGPGANTATRSIYGAELALATQGITAKNTSLFMADGEGATKAEVVLIRDYNTNFMGGLTIADGAYVADPVTGLNINYRSTYYTDWQWKGTFTAYDGSSHTVNNLDDFKAWNTWVIGELQAGRLLTSQYNAEFTKAYTTTTYNYLYDPFLGQKLDPATDTAFTRTIKQVLAEAHGSNATARVAPGVNQWVTQGGDDGLANGTVSGVLYASDGGTIINEGMISGRYGGAGTPQGMVVDGINAGVKELGSLMAGYNTKASVGYNNGIINVAYLAGWNIDAAFSPGMSVTSGGSGVARGEGALLVNNGIVNVAASYGLYAMQGGEVINHGAINLGLRDFVSGTSAGNMVAAQAADADSKFTNAADGVIYIGRNPGGPVEMGIGSVTSTDASGKPLYSMTH